MHEIATGNTLRSITSSYVVTYNKGRGTKREDFQTAVLINPVE